jgi:predicted ATPase
MIGRVMTDGNGGRFRGIQVCPPRCAGRDTQAARLAAALARPPTVVLVEGQAGIGKSCLVHEVLGILPGLRSSSLVARCPAFGRPLTLEPLVAALQDLGQDLPKLRLSPLAGALHPLFPGWAGLLPQAPEPLADAAAERQRVFRALAGLLDCLGTGLLVVEDAQWADEATLEFLLFLAMRHVPGLGLVVTFRPEEISRHSLLRRLWLRPQAGSRCERITLEPLDVAETADLADSMLPGGKVSGKFAAFLHDRTGGLPMAVEEAIRLLYDRADLTFRDGKWLRRHLPSLVIPPTAEDTVRQRAQRLGAHAQTVLRAAAVLAEPSRPLALSSVSGLDEDETGWGLAEALDRGLLIRTSTAASASSATGVSLGATLAARVRPEPAISFRHETAASVVYETIPHRQLRRMHLLAAWALESQTPLPASRLAWHFREADDMATWARYARQATDVAIACGDEAAAALFSDQGTDGARLRR